MDYSLLLGVHFPSRNLMTRVSLEPLASASLDGMSLPHASPLAGGLSTMPGSASMSAAGSLAESYFTSAGGQAGAGITIQPRSTISDDDTQQPPQQLQRLVAQHQQLEASVAAAASAGQSTAGSVGTPTLRSARQSLEQLPQQLTVQFSPSDDAQQQAAAAQQYPISSGGGGHTAGGAAGASAGGGSVAGSHQAHMMAAGLSAASAKNWELYSGAAEQEQRLTKVTGRMREMGFNEQMVKVRLDKG